MFFKKDIWGSTAESLQPRLAGALGGLSSIDGGLSSIDGGQSGGDVTQRSQQKGLS